MEYNPNEDAVLVIVDFPAAVVASAFAMRFGTSISYLPEPASPDGRQPTT
jgi:hypothetical protein